MVRRTYSNKINYVEVSLAIERLLIAHFPTVWTPARIDLDSLPSGFFDLGAVVEDTPVFRYNREKFKLEAGLPKISQFESVTMVGGQFETRLHSNSWRKLQFALGNYSAVSSITVSTSITSVHSDGLTLVIAGTLSTTVGAHLVVGPTLALLDNADAQELTVTSMSSVTILTIQEPTAPAAVAGWIIAKYDRVEQFFGTNRIRYYSLLGVADFINGAQVVHEMRKVTPSDTFEEALRPDNTAQIPLLFDGLGWEATVAGCTQLVVAKRHYFPSVGGC